MKQIAALVVGLALLACDGASAQTPPVTTSAAPSSQQTAEATRRSVLAVRMGDDEAIVLDGKLDEPVWQRATPATDFFQQDPANGQPATEPTLVRIVYDKKTLYMGVTCLDDEPDRMLRFQRRRDEFLQADDRFQWVLDPFLTAQNGYFFETNPSGLMGDSLISPTGGNRQWDGIWDLRVLRDDLGWTVEIAIPFSTLNFAPSATSWGINFQRTVRRKNEDSLWNGWGRNQGLQRLSNAGLLQGMNQNVSQGLGLEVRPFGVAVVEASPVTGQPKTRASAATGIDVFYSLTPGLRANFTLNTDFAQTEVDQRAVNLTRFPLFFPEKRTFFLEGASLFDFGSVSSVGSGGGGGFSRPADNSLLPFFSRRIGLNANGDPQKIDYGVKLIGQIGRQDIGVLQVQTGDDAGVLGENFTVFRAKRRLLRQSYVGGLYTARHPGDLSPTLQTAGADFQLATSTFRGTENVVLGGYFLRNTNPLDTGKSSSYGLRLDYPNDRWNAGMSYRNVDQNFAPSVGFTLRNGYQRYNPYLNFSPRPLDSRRVRRMGFTADVDLQADPDNQFLTRIWNLTVFNIDLQTQDTFSFLVMPEYERLNRTFAIYPRISLPSGGEYNFLRYRVTASTANRRLIAISPTFEWGDFYSGTRQQFSADVTIRARPGVIFYLSSEYNRVELKEGRFETTLVRATPELQFSQWVSVVNTIQYDSVSAVLGWQSRFRWILKPGNDIYVVYTHNWLNDTILDRFSTLNRRAASKVLYTRRF